MRLGAPLFKPYASPSEWAAVVQSQGYRAAYCPVNVDAGDDVIRAYAQAAQDADIVIAEVGVWNNPLSSDPVQREAAIAKCKKSLLLADKIGARCCVNLAGSRGPIWHGPHPLDLTDETFEMIVTSVQDIIDAVQPARTAYTLEAMQWLYPDSPDSYLRLIKAIDRKACAVHLDPVNMVNSPERFFHNGALIQDCFAKLGPYIRSCHAKDVAMSDSALVHLDEVRIGLGKLDYATFLFELSKLDPDTPLMLEHLPTAEDYDLAATHVRAVAAQEGLAL